MSSPRESLASRMGFILLSAGCAIGLGHVWRFPFIVGRYGGCIFVLFYLLFLFIMGFPLLLTEISIGRGSRKNLVHAMHDLAHTHKKAWGTIGFILLMGCLILMMYYTTVSGWLFAYTSDYMRGAFKGLQDASKYGEVFDNLVKNPVRSTISMAIVCIISGGVCAIGLKRGVESVVKVLMVALMLLILVLAIYAMTLPNAAEGLKFYLLPNVDNFMKNPMETIFAAMGQAFFTLSIGIGSMEIFGSYLDWKTSLTKECIWIIALDTFVAFSSGLIIFPVCASNNIDVSAGPPLIFVSLPSVFATLPGGQFWGFLFFRLFRQSIGARFLRRRGLQGRKRGMQCFVASDGHGNAFGHRQGVVRIEPVIQHPLHQPYLGAFRYIDGIPTAFLHIGIGPDRQPGTKKQGTNGDQSAEVPEQLIHFTTPLGIIPLFSSIALKNKE